MDAIVTHLNKAFGLTRDLAVSLTQDDLKRGLPNLPSNSIAQQLWCVVGARESYLEAIVHEAWQGFGCSLSDPTSKVMVLACLEASAAKCLEYVDGRELSPLQAEFLLDLLEHEVQHHGQLIRYVYGNRLAFPESWAKRYTV